MIKTENRNEEKKPAYAEAENNIYVERATAAALKQEILPEDNNSEKINFFPWHDGHSPVLCAHNASDRL